MDTSTITGSPLQAVPQELASRRHWVGWHPIEKRLADGTVKLDKAHDDPGWPNSNNWRTLDALRADERPAFVFPSARLRARGAELIALDLDSCRSADGTIHRWAQEVIAHCGNSYTEITPSGAGLRVWVAVKNPPQRWSGHVFVPSHAEQATNCKKVQCEVFGDGSLRWVTVTGIRLASTSIDIVEIDNLDWWEALFGRSAERVEGAASTGNFTLDDLDAAKFALQHVRADERDRWVKIGMALFAFGDKGKDVWFAWSATSRKFDRADAERVWTSFDQGHENRPTLASVFWIADQEDGQHPERQPWRDSWRGVKPSAFQPLDDEGGESEVEDGDGARDRAVDPFRGRWQPVDGEWLDVDPPPQKFLLRHPKVGEAGGAGFLPQSILALLAGAGGIGKTELVLSLAIAAATGGKWLGHFEVDADAARGKFLVLTAEEDQDEVRRRLHRLTRFLTAEQRAAVCRRLVVAPMAGVSVALLGKSAARGALQSTIFLKALRDRLEAEAGAEGWSGLFMGPLARLAGVSIDADNEHATAVMTALESLCEVPGRPLVLVDAHTAGASRKVGEEAKVRGATGLHDAARWVATMQWRADGAVDLSVAKSNRTAADRQPLVLERMADGSRCVRGSASVGTPAEQVHEATVLADRAEERRQALLAALRSLGGEVGSAEEVYALLSGKTGLKRAAWHQCVTLGLIVPKLEGRGAKRWLCNSGIILPQRSNTPTPLSPKGARGEAPAALWGCGAKGERGEGGAKGRSDPPGAAEGMLD